jgi:amino acid adenylation domain-containing protein
MQATPATWQMLLDAGWKGAPHLKILCGGEALPPTLADELLERCASLWNMFGPTETTIWSTVEEVKPRQTTVSIGQPIANTTIYILDGRGQLLPPGIPGEIHIGGEGLAIGYLNRKELTDKRFIPDPFSPDPAARLYRTGDLARRQLDGSLEFLGRIDNQVKIRGYRIECGEVEAALCRHPMVRSAVVVARKERVGDEHLVAYVIAESEGPAAASALRAHLLGRLPEYMVPNQVVFLDGFPLTPNGKVDRRALPAPDLARSRGAERAAPTNPLEAILVEIWREVMSVADLGIHDSFFDLGGHSLQAGKILARVRDRLGVDLALHELFQAPTVARLAGRVESLQHANTPPSVRSLRSSGGGREAPMSSAQQRLWFLDRLHPGSTAYSCPSLYRLRGPLNTAALEQSLNAVIARHQTLRTAFSDIDGKPVQVIHRALVVTLDVVDPSDRPADEGEATAMELAEAEARRPFDLASLPLIRARLFRLDAEDHLLLLNLHHIVTDGWSTSVLHWELSMFYRAAASGKTAMLPPLSIQYTDYAISQRAWLGAPDGTMARQLSYWTGRLAGAPPLLALPTDRPRPPVASLRGARRHLTLGWKVLARLRALSQEAEATLFMTLLAGFTALLHRHTGQNDILVGVPAANRQLADVEPLIGCFVNTLVIRVDLSDAPSFRELLGRVRREVAEAYDNQNVPFETLVEALRPERALSHNPLVQAMIAPQEGTGDDFSLPGLSVEAVPLDPGTALLDLCLFISEKERRLLLSLEYSSDLYDPTTIDRMLGHLRELLEGVAEDPDARIPQLCMLTDAERRTLAAWSHTAADYPKDACIHELFEAQVDRTPGAVAAVFKDEQVTYRELDARANQLAHRLQGLGVGPAVLVGIHMDRSLAMLIALLGVFKAGGAYVPLDPKYPRERLDFMVADSAAPVVITQERLAPEWARKDVALVCVDSDAATITCHSTHRPSCAVGPQDLAYIIYTSGSTGVPKGVAIPHRSAAAFISWALGEFTAEELANVLASTSTCFDLSIFEMFVPLCGGGAVTVVENVLQLLGLSGRAPVTLLNTVPSAMAELLRAGAIPASVRAINLAGEPLSRALVDQIYQRTAAARVLNLYGPSETTTYSTFSEVPREAMGAPTLGKPISNTAVFVLDRGLQLVPIGVAGEICIGGAGLARGYLDRPDQSAARFIPDPWGSEPGSRLYRTGDLARWRPDGTLEFLGRSDNQVKIRGFRIEPGEIEASLRRHPDVRDAVVVAREDRPGDRRLVAYVAVASPDATVEAVLRGHLRGRLPEFSVPSHIIALGALPLTPNGKVDRRALPPPDRGRARREGGFLAPSTTMEKAVAELLKDLLDLEDVGVEQNFFDLGAHSLLLLKLQALIAQQIGPQLSVADFFRHTNIRQLAGHIDAILNPSADRASIPAPRGLGRGSSVLPPRRSGDADTTVRGGIAIVGMAGRFPGAEDVNALWSNLCSGREGISFFEPVATTASGAAPQGGRHVGAQGLLSDVDGFDAAFFGYSPREATWIDPQQRLFLQICWSALEHAGHVPQRVRGAIGVFGGAGRPRYWLSRIAALASAPGSIEEYQGLLGNGPDFLTTRVSYKLGLTGPSLDIQTACSTSLVAVHVACEQLLSGHCDMALAGGVSIFELDAVGYRHEPDGILSADGRCRPFDAAATGTVPASGVAVVVLKRLEDALTDGDTVYAVLRGTAINNDGSKKVGFTAPSVVGQAQVVRDALRRAGLSAADISYVEAHGTGTSLGDPIEVDALSQAFREDTGQRGFCGIGSLKSNLGHLDAAAGVASLIKVALSLYHEVIPPTLHFKHPNPKLDLGSSPFHVVDALRPWPRGSRRRCAGVSAFGLGGTNAHAIVEEAPAAPRRPEEPAPPYLLVLSARTGAALEAATSRLADHLTARRAEALGDAASTLQIGRGEFRHRRSVVATSLDDAVDALRNPAGKRIATSVRCDQEPRVVFMFPGVAVQYAGMGAGIYRRWPLFRECIDRCAELFASRLGADILEQLYPGDSAPAADLARPSLSMSTIFSVSYALSRLLVTWGVRPHAAIGHSLGEYAAACLAGALSLEDAVALVAARGLLCDGLPEGAMVSVPLGEELVRELVDETVSISAVNGPSRCVVSGSLEAISRLEARMSGRGIACRRLPVTRALHSALVEPAMAALAELGSTLARNAPAMPLISNVTGRWMTPPEAEAPDYWARHLRAPVRFSDGLGVVLRDGCDVLLEVGPGNTLTTLARQHPELAREHRVMATMLGATAAGSDTGALLDAAGRLWGAGCKLNWSEVHAGGVQRRIALPTYPFETVRHRLAAPRRDGPPGDLPTYGRGPGPYEAGAAAPASAPSEKESGPVSGRRSPARREPVDDVASTVFQHWAALLGIEEVDPNASFFDLGGDSLSAIQLAARLSSALGVDLSAHVVLEHPTALRLASWIRAFRVEARQAGPTSLEDAALSTAVAARRNAQSPLLVKLRDGVPGRTPLFLIHPAGGTVFEYRGLLPTLDDEPPVYGVRAIGLEAGEAVCTSLEAMARRYLEEVLACCPQGPFALGGHSSGGALAYEMAQQLSNEGYELSSVIMMDTVSVTFSQEARIEEVEHLRQLLGPFERSAPGAYRRLLDGLEGSHRFREYLLALNKALARYRPKPLRTPILYLRAVERDERFDPHSEAFWIRLADAGFECHNVPGNHFTMMEDPHRRAMGRLIARRLREAPALALVSSAPGTHAMTNGLDGFHASVPRSRDGRPSEDDL